MPRAPRVTGAELVRALQRAGWAEHEQEGSHVQLKHPTRPGKVTVPVHAGRVILPRRWPTSCARRACRPTTSARCCRLKRERRRGSGRRAEREADVQRVQAGKRTYTVFLIPTRAATRWRCPRCRVLHPGRDPRRGAGQRPRGDPRPHPGAGEGRRAGAGGDGGAQRPSSSRSDALGDAPAGAR